MKTSPFAPKTLPVLAPIRGVKLAACEAGIRYQGRKDLMLALLPPQTVAAGVLTRSKTAAAPVLWCRERLAQSRLGGRARALVVNAGNANAFTGMRGTEAVRSTAKAAAQAAQCQMDEVFIASTGVIGEPLAPSRFLDHLVTLAETASDQPESWQAAAEAIMTTDTYPKLACWSGKVGGVPIHINGIAKGSGMIAPDMATMLAFMFTDAAIDQAVLQAMVAANTEPTFNSITVDSDTSTSDTVLVFATGSAGAPISDLESDAAGQFNAGLHAVMRDLARQIVMDGEGISKFVTIKVTGAENDRAAKVIALAIANSPLVKTAIAGEDPNWGRVVAAVGKAGEAADRDRLSIWLGDIEVARNGEAAASYQEAQGAAYMKNPEITIRVDVGIADGQARVWTCDLTHDYISINADYRS